MADAVASFERASVEWKLDGIRIQMHRRGDEVRIYTRNLNEITAALPGIVDAVRAPAGDAAVLDGEAMWMGEDGPAAFQDTVVADRPRRAAGGVVDVLLRPAARRRRGPARRAACTSAPRGSSAIAPQLGIPGVVTSDPRRGRSASWTSRSRAGHEGVMVKDAASLYAAGRRGKAWRKVKPVRTYDLVVLGAEWGHGRRQGWLSNLHLGARDPARAGS